MPGVGSGRFLQRSLLIAVAACLLLVAGCGTETTTTVTERVVKEKPTAEQGITSPTGCVNVSTGEPASCAAVGSVTSHVYNEANDLSPVDDPVADQVEEDVQLERRQDEREDIRAAIRRQRQREKADEETTTTPVEEDCDPNYEGACLDPNASDYDCEGGSGDGPEYTGPVTVVGDDHYGLDTSDGDPAACEPY